MLMHKILPTMKPAASEKRATGGALTQQVNASEAAVSSTVQIKETDAESQKPEIKLDLSKVKIEPLFEEEVDFDTFSRSDFRAVKIKNCEEVPKSEKLLLVDDRIPAGAKLY